MHILNTRLCKLGMIRSMLSREHSAEWIYSSILLFQLPNSIIALSDRTKVEKCDFVIH